MITRTDAETIAEQVLGQPSDDPLRGWELEEFEEGWLVRTATLNDTTRRGAAPHVIERESGIVRRFPSSVPTKRILQDYVNVRDRGLDAAPS